MSTAQPLLLQEPWTDPGWDVTVVVPTRNEAPNIRPLVAGLMAALAGLRAEILFVDDSTDGTPDAIRGIGSATDSDGFRVRLLHRAPGERTGGLGGAVVAGFRAAEADVVVVMDGDLQHPPATARVLVEALRERGSDVVVASRYCSDGTADGLSSSVRHLVSSGSAALARGLFPRRLRRVSDPMSGFFAARRAAIPVDALRPRGFKILLELLARANPLTASEIPFAFAPRADGRSKASWQEGARFLRQLVSLRANGASSLVRLLRFAAVGAKGAVVDLAVLTALLAVLPTAWEAVAAVLATEVAIAWNFTLTRSLVFGDRAAPLWRTAATFFAVNSASLVIQLPLAAALVRTGVSYETATGVAIVLLMVGRFLIADRLLFARIGDPPSPGASAAACHLIRPDPGRAQ